MKKSILVPVMLILVTTLLISCSKDEAKKTSLTEFNYMDNEQFDYVIYVRNSCVYERDSQNQIGLAVLKEDSFLDEVFLNYEGEQFVMTDLAGGRIWSCPQLDYLADLEATTLNMKVKGYLNDELVLDQLFELQTVEFPCECIWPEATCELVEDEYGYEHYVAMDVEMSWSLDIDNDYQTLWVNRSPYYNLRNFHINLKANCRCCVVKAIRFHLEPENVMFTLSQMNTSLGERFLAISLYEQTRCYGEEFLIVEEAIEIKHIIDVIN